MTTSADRLAEMMRVKIETLFGERGDPDHHAVRQKDLIGLNNALGGLVKQTGSLASSINGAQSTAADAVSNLTAIGNLVKSLRTDLDAAQADVSGLQAKTSAASAVKIPSLLSGQAAGAAPTAAEFNKAIDDLAALRTALSALISAL